MQVTYKLKMDLLAYFCICINKLGLDCFVLYIANPNVGNLISLIASVLQAISTLPRLFFSAVFDNEGLLVLKCGFSDTPLCLFL